MYVHFSIRRKHWLIAATCGMQEVVDAKKKKKKSKKKGGGVGTAAETPEQASVAATNGVHEAVVVINEAVAGDEDDEDEAEGAGDAAGQFLLNCWSRDIRIEIVRLWVPYEGLHFFSLILMDGLASVFICMGTQRLQRRRRKRTRAASEFHHPFWALEQWLLSTYSLNSVSCFIEAMVVCSTYIIVWILLLEFDFAGRKRACWSRLIHLPFPSLTFSLQATFQKVKSNNTRMSKLTFTTLKNYWLSFFSWLYQLLWFQFLHVWTSKVVTGMLLFLLFLNLHSFYAIQKKWLDENVLVQSETLSANFVKGLCL